MAGDQHLLPGLSTEYSTVGWLPAQARPLPSSPPTLPIKPASVSEIAGIVPLQVRAEGPCEAAFLTGEARSLEQLAR